jgi:hypothetical protein
LLTALRFNGSSIGVFHTYLYGNQNDPALVAGQPRDIRSDEWLVRTPKTIAQSNNQYSRIDNNIGNGEDESVSLDLPYKDWSTVFRPTDWAFFVMGFDYAFAFKWWLMGYLLLISAYFFVLKLLPGKRMIAACTGAILLFSPFVQWWYEYDTLASLFFTLFLGLSFIKLMRSKSRITRMVLTALIAWLLVCFALILYPPFQVACALVLAAFVISYLLEIHPRMPSRELLGKMVYGLAAIMVSGIVVLVFLHTRSAAVQAIQNTVYPGKRVVKSGGFSKSNLFSGQLDFQLQFSGKAGNYLVGGVRTNQSEASNFILLLPFMLLPSAYMFWSGWRKDKELDWPLITTGALFVLLLVRLFVPHTSSFFKFFALGYVPHQRLIIGIGLLSAVQTVLIIRWLTNHRKKSLEISPIWVAAYSAVVLILELALNFHIMHNSPGFIGHYRAIAFSIPIPIVVYLLLRKKYSVAMGILAVFSIFTCLMVNPVYKGTGVLTDTKLSASIKQIASKDNGRWVAEGLIWENFPQMNGARSISGTYSYPQLELWRSIDHGTKEYIYNRYEHAEFVIDRSDTTDSTSISLAGGDHIQILTTPCSTYLKNAGIKYILAEGQLKTNAACAEHISTISYPGQNFYLYRLR